MENALKQLLTFSMKIFLIILIISLCLQSTYAQSKKDVQDIRKTIILFQEDFNEGSFRNSKEYTTNDWIHINPGGGISVSRDSVLKEVRNIHQTALKGMSMTISNSKIKFVAPGIAIANVVHNISIYEMPKGVIHENERQRKTYLFIKRKGKWLLTLDQNTIIQK